MAKYTRPDVSCHPETLLEGARTVVSAALCYWAEEGERPPGHGRLPRYTWWDAYAALRERLDELGISRASAASGFGCSGWAAFRRTRIPS